MTRAQKTLAVLFVASLGIWGCSQGPSSGGVAAKERIRALEAKSVRLEDDFRNVAAARDQLRKQMTDLENDRSRLRQDLDRLRNAEKERDALCKQVKDRTSERDAVQVQYESFRKGIRELLGQADARLPRPTDRPITRVPSSSRSNPS